MFTAGCGCDLIRDGTALSLDLEASTCWRLLATAMPVPEKGLGMSLSLGPLVSAR